MNFQSGGDVEEWLNGGGLQDRYPSHADAVGARGEPNRVDRLSPAAEYSIISGMVWRSEAVPARSSGRRRPQVAMVPHPRTSELEAGIGGRSVLALRRQCVGVCSVRNLSEWLRDGPNHRRSRNARLAHPTEGARTR